MNVLVTGATGFLGSRIVEHLARFDTIHFIVATGRKFSSNNKVADAKVKYLLGDLGDEVFVKSLFIQSIDVVINCASLSSPWGDLESFHQANIVTQQFLIKECLSAGVKRFIYISTPSIYFDFKDAINISEQTPLPNKMVNNYATTKWRAECLLEESDLPYVILRPRALIGRGDTVIMPRLIRSYKQGKLKIMGNGKNRVDLTSVSNMAEAVRLAIFTDNVNEAYNISNGEPVNLWASINDVLEAIGFKKITGKIPYSVLYAVAYLMEIKSKITGRKEPVLTRYSVGVLAKSFSFDIKKAREKLNYKPKQTTTEAIKEFAEWYKKTNND